ncbi:MAG: serine protein kinase RIO [Candidatus Iainarchaeum archaeon]|uniref:non-specific serine/threonine protein kinase n=1 Tax=Candidatus Iainarchaeum sp. TaxID=3101447 RepID=A0A497JHY4_9ARCH|nr:MAG: serine protein kinase RIO [Candidatus Diapherotrites archaeon]
MKGKLFFKDEKAKKIFDKVFDYNTLLILHELASKGWFDCILHVVSTGKEAHVFKAQDINAKPRAVKIYKIETSEFKNMIKYIEGDIRFKHVRRDKRHIVFTWTKKEYKNLDIAKKAGANVPMPLAYRDNVLVMEFIGDENAAPLLKDVNLNNEELEKAYWDVIDSVAKMLFKAKFVHADISEYNMLYWKGKVYLIDIGQGVLLSHPHAKEFLERDLRNISKFFSKRGLKKDLEDVKRDLKEKKKEIQL